MTYDEGLAHRIRERLGDRPGITENQMFGGIAFMLNGNMVCGVVDDALMARVGPDAYEDALAEPHAREMNFTGRPMKGMVFVDLTGRPMKGMVFVDPAGISEDDALDDWIERCLAFAETLPAK